MTALGHLQEEIAACRICRDQPAGKPLPHEPRPVAVLSPTARIAICGQAPGVRVHQSGRPFTDPSGDRLREWMGVDEAVFYDSSRIAIIPMGFCFPGHDAKGGDLAPRRECAAHWHDRIFAAMPHLKLMLVVGQYAHRYHLKEQRRDTLTDTVGDWQAIVDATVDPVIVPLPHPSWRNNAWIKKNPWFSSDLLPYLQKMIQDWL